MAIAEMPTQRTSFPLLGTDELDAELAAALEDAGAPPDFRTGGRRFEIENESAADWAMRKLQLLMRRLESAKSMASGQISAIEGAAQVHHQRISDRVEVLRQPIEQWLNEETTKLAPEIAFFEDLLQRYHLAVLAEDPKRKTLKLPHGQIEARKLSDEWRYGDEALFLDYARGTKPELIRVTEAPVKDAVKKVFEAAPEPNEDGTYDVIDPKTGDIVPGICFIPGGVKVTVKPELEP